MSSTQSDAEFERSLLESAQHDQPNHDTGEAWAKLCAALAPLQAAAPVEPPQPRAAAAAQAAVARHAAGWVLLGGVGGALVTALWFGALHTPPAAPAAPVREDRPVVAPAREGAASATTEPAREPAPPAASAEPAREPAPHRKALAPAPVKPAAPAPERSSLSAEVAALDRANAALRAGRFSEALRAIEQYQRDFAHGVLLRDAEVIAIDALDGLHDARALAQRARQFLARYPSDPHAARVASLLRALR